MAKEIALTVQISIDPDLTKHVKRTNRKHTDVSTGEAIPAKSSCYKVAWRYDGRLMSGYMTEENHDILLRL